MQRTCRILACALLAAVSVLPLHAQSAPPSNRSQSPRTQTQSERILDYHSDIALQQDGTFLVRETITVNSRGIQIRHGIFRDFPTRYTDRFGRNYVVGFHFVSAELDGYQETSRIQDVTDGKRIYLGDQKYFVSSGQHTYVIAYTTNRQLGFFPDHDEMYWNATGNGWGFPIDHASATVTLPKNIIDSGVSLDGFTGPLHSFDRNLTHQQQPDGSCVFETTAPLRVHDGLSIVLSWQKGLIAPPTQRQQLDYFLSDNGVMLLSAAALLILLTYYVIVWFAVGRDPARGVVMPLYEPPSNLSPAATRFLVRMGFDNKTFAAAILDMAVRGYLTIKEQAGSYTLYRTKSDDRALTPDEKQLAAVLFDNRDQLWLHNENHTIIKSGMTALKNWLKLAEEKVYFFTNSRFSIPAIVLSVLMLLGISAVQSTFSVFVTVFLSFWLSIWSLACAGLVIGCASCWKTAFTAPASKTLLAGKALMTTLFSLPFLFGEGFGFWMLGKAGSIFIPIFLIATVILHILFHYLLKAPTFAGRRLMDQVDGFKLFLGAVDGDRLNRVMPPDKTPETFEKFLPYALALDLEQAWSQKFSAGVATAGTTPSNGSTAYSPSFYSGSNWNGFGASGFAGGFSSSFTSAVSSSASAPGSSSGSSGGSGGGGGGGGGGGW